MSTQLQRGLPRPFVGIAVAIGIVTMVWAGLSLAALTTRQTERSSRTYPAGGPLELNAASGDVTIVAEDRAGVRVDSRATWSLAEPDLELRRVGDRLVLDGRCGFWGSIGPGSCSTSFEIHVPRDTPIVATTQSGDMRIVGSDADARLQASSGDLRAEDVGGVLALETSSGDVDVLGFRGAEASTRTSSGDLTVRAEVAPDRIVAETSSGDVTVAVPDADYRVEAQTDSGDEDVQVRQDPDAQRTIDARTSSGNVEIVRLGDAR